MRRTVDKESNTILLIFIHMFTLFDVFSITIDYLLYKIVAPMTRRGRKPAAIKHVILELKLELINDERTATEKTREKCELQIKGRMNTGIVT